MAVPQPATQYRNDSSLAKGKSKTVQKGHAGTKIVTYKQKYVNGVKSGAPTVVGSKPVKSATPTIIHVGTKAAAKVTYKTFTKSSTIAKPKAKHVNDSSLYVGEHKTVAGHAGTKVTTYKQKYVNGKKSGAAAVVGTKTTKSAVADVIHDGTKAKPAAHWVYDGSKASQVAALIAQYRVSQGKSSIPHSASSSVNENHESIITYGASTPSGALSNFKNSPEHNNAILDSDVFVTSVVCGWWDWSDPGAGKGPYAACII